MTFVVVCVLNMNSVIRKVWNYYRWYPSRESSWVYRRAGPWFIFNCL